MVVNNSCKVDQHPGVKDSILTLSILFVKLVLIGQLHLISNSCQLQIINSPVGGECMGSVAYIAKVPVWLYKCGFSHTKPLVHVYS